MFSRVFRRNTSVHTNAVPAEQPVEPQVQGTSNAQTEIQSSSGKRKQSRNEETEIPAKYSRFELEGESNSKGWDLSSGLASYLNKYMSIHVSEKDIREKILQNNLVPRNVKVCQRLDEYIKELLLENKKSSTLYHEKILKGIQEKIVSVLAPLTKLRSFMEEERELISPDDEASDGHQEIASLFEQTVLLVGQAFNSVAYQRRLNVLNTLIDNSVKGDSKGTKLDLDATDNGYLFGEKFEEQLSKITSAKQKSKAIFTGLQRKPNMMNQFVNPVNQPFRSGPLPNSQQRGRGRGFLFARGRRGKQLLSMSVSSTESGNTRSTRLSSHTSSDEKVVICRKHAEFLASGSSSVFPEKLGKVNKRSFHFRVSKGISDSIPIRTISNGTSQHNFNESGGNCHSGPGNSGNVEERCNKISPTRHKKSVSKFNIYSPKKGLRAPPCDKPKEIEQAYSLYPFQNGGSFSLEGNASQRGLYVQDRPKRCILFSATKSQIPKICEFQVERSNLSVSLPLLQPGTSTQDIYKTTEGSYFSDEEVECSIDNFSGRYSTDGCLGGGVDIGTGHPHLPTSEFGFSDQYKEICASTMPNHTVFRHGDKLDRYECNSSTGEKGSDSKTVSRSSEEVISFITGADSTYWEAGINSHCSSASTTPISSNATPANIGVICSRKLQLRNKIRRGEGNCNGGYRIFT